MSWNGHIVVDMDARIRERADRFFLGGRTAIVEQLADKGE